MDENARMNEDSNSKARWKWGRSHSWNIRKPDWHVLWITILLLVGYFIAGELFFRLDPVQRALSGPRIGSSHEQFEIQVARLDKLVREGETIDCIFLGNSMIWLGVDPLVIDQVFQSRTGREIHCFNFGVSALPASSAGRIAPMLVDKYHPKLLVYGTFARDYAIPAEVEDASAVSDTPWLRYQNGELNTEGWLYDHSSVFRYKSHMRDILLRRYLESVFIPEDSPAYQAYGLDPKVDVRLDVRQLPDKEDVDNRDPVKWLSHYEIQEENVDGLRRILQLSDHETTIVVLEMPFHENALDFFANGDQDYARYIQQVSSAAETSHTPVWYLKDQPPLPLEGWWDYFHLNLKGARLFSEWLGNQVADAYLQGVFRLSGPAAPY